MNQPEHTQQFGVRPFAVGTVTGLRAFRLHSCGDPDCWAGNGLLRAVSADYVWKPGENVAVCTPLGMSWMTGTGQLQPMVSNHTQLAGVGCTCGFYAYFGDRNDYASSWSPGDTFVGGIVEGYGVVTVGSRGFRAEKARIVALIRPHVVFGSPQSVIEVLKSFGVPIYDTTAEALAAHPTTKPEDVGFEPSADSERLPANGGGGARVLWGGNPPIGVFASQRFAQSAAALDDQVRKLLQSLNRTQPSPTQFASGGLVPGTTSPEVDEPDDEPAIGTPARRRADKEAAAERRRSAGLKGIGGFDRRGRRR